MVLRVNCYVNHRSHKLFCQGLYNLLPHSKPGKKIENLESVFEECKTELHCVKSVIMVIILNNAEMLLNFPPRFLQALFSIPKKVYFMMMNRKNIQNACSEIKIEKSQLTVSRALKFQFYGRFSIHLIFYPSAIYVKYSV